ncbi:hypothetical protein Tco_0517299 [Tanacetum coccineum]
MYMEHIQEVTPDVVDNSGPIFDTEPLQKVQNNDDNYNVFANDREHSEYVNDTYLEEQGDTNITIDSLDISTNEEMVDQDDDGLARERCYNDNLALMLAPESDETIRLAQESRSKLSDLIRHFDYSKLNNLYDLFIPQLEKSAEQRYFSEREYYYADHMNAILGVHTTLDEFTDLQCDYVVQVVKCESLEKEISKSNTTSKSFEALQQHAINLELALQ